MTGFLSQVWVRARGRRVLLVTAMAVSLRKIPAIIVQNLRASMTRGPARMSVFRLIQLALCGCVAATTAGLPTLAHAQVSLERLHAFPQTAPQGPRAPLVQGSDGNFYGTTLSGGAYENGTVFKVSPSGTLTILHSFTRFEGRFFRGLLQASDGNFYGISPYGGLYDNGTVFKMTPDGTVTVLCSFSNTTSLAYPFWELIEANGVLYGTVRDAVFSLGLSAGSSCQPVRIFGFPNPYGHNPNGPLLRAADGNLYGTLASGGTFGFGSIFKMTPDGSALTVLHAFSAGGDGASPQGRLAQAGDGSILGTTNLGGSSGFGTVFRLKPDSSLEILHSFNATNGAYPGSGLIRATDSNFYGTVDLPTSFIRTAIFRIAIDGSFAVVHVLDSKTEGSDAAGSGVIQGSDGLLYGAASSGGIANSGTVFRMSLDGRVSVVEAFLGNPEGVSPGLQLQTSDGSLYGVADGGLFNRGIVFKMTTGGALTVLHTFAGGPTDGTAPTALIQGADGQFYGTTESGGQFDMGIVFRMTSDGTMTLLHSFAGGLADGAKGGFLVQGRDGNLYGATKEGGANELGTAFRLSLDGALTILHTFGTFGATEDLYSPGSFIQATDGNFYGTATNSKWCTASVFRMSADGTLAVLYTLDVSDGDYSCFYLPGIVQGRDGNLYGTRLGIKGQTGLLYRITLQGVVTIIGEFPWWASPIGSLVPGADGNLYGVFRRPGYQAISRVRPDGAVTVLHPLQSSAVYDLLPGNDGALYGTIFDYQSGRFLTAIFRLRALAPGVPRTWQMSGVGDIDGDGKADLVWRNTQTGDVAIWLMAGLTVRLSTVVSTGVPLAWQLSGVGDLDGDGKADLVWRNIQSGDVAVWLMNGAAVKGSAVVSYGVPFDWQLSGVADFDSDGRADLLWRHTKSGDVALWLMDGATVTASPGVPLEWRVAGVADSTGDGRAKVIWRNSRNGNVAVWVMHGAVVEQSAVLAYSVPSAWQIGGVRGRPNDGDVDLVWRNSQDGDVAEWRAHLTSVVQSAVMLPDVSLTWQVVGVGDADGDGTVDLFWRDMQTGDVAVWLNGGTVP